jgi:hypothetical protein
MLYYVKVHAEYIVVVCCGGVGISINQLNLKFCYKELDFALYCYLLMRIAYLIRYLLLFFLISDKYLPVQNVPFFIHILVLNIKKKTMYRLKTKTWKKGVFIYCYILLRKAASYVFYS